ncbi:MAG: hypothetical protein CME06_15855 [Gemmatimonadetes bacterium]|nr:hypothetical protein [Gemmatimonadota bacterium]
MTDVQGAKRGVLVLSLDGAQLLDELTELGLRAPGPTMLLNASGSYLSGVPPERRWGFLFGRTDLSFRVDHPEAWARISAQRSGQIQTRNGIFSFAAIGEGQNALRIVSQVPAEESRKGANRLFERLLWVGGAASIPLFVLSAYLAHAREARRRQRKAIVDSERRLRSLSERLFSLQEQERRSISRDLHDELGQLVTAITIELRGAAKAAPESTAGHIRRAEKAASLLLQELHGVVARLRPTILDDLGLLEAIRSYARDFERTTGIALELRLDPSSHPIPPKVSESVYRIVQEGLTNAAKHAGSESITLSMVASEDRVIVEIADDGEGFDPRATESDRFGLLGMRERAELMGGELVLHSTPGEGTRISLSVPLERGFGPEEHLS